MAFKVFTAALFVVLMASSVACRPLAGRQLLDAASDLIAGFNNGTNQNSLSTLYADLLRTNPNLAINTVQTLIQQSTNNGRQNTLGNIIAAGSNAPNVPAQIALNVASEATGTPVTSLGNSGGSSVSNAIVNATVNNGQAAINVMANSGALAMGTDATLKACVSAISEVRGGQTAVAAADIAATAIGQAASVAFATVTVQITSTGDADIKAQADGIAASWATAFAQVIVDAFVQAINDNARATAAINLTATSQVFTSAFAAASLKVSQQGQGSINAINSAIAVDIKAPLAQILARVLAVASSAPPATG